MASYLKFGGKLGGGINFAFPGPPSDNYVLTTFARFLSWPTGRTPIFTVQSSAPNLTMAGLWIGDPVNLGVAGVPTNRRNLLAANWNSNVGEGFVEQIAAPVRLGRIFKLQLIVSESFNVAVAVDGVRVATAAFGGTTFPPLGVSIYVLGTNNGVYRGTSAPLRAHHMEMIQAMVEIDRTLVNSGGFPAVDADSDPFTDLALGAGATSDSALWLLDDGAGASAVDSSGNGHTLTLSDDFTWAPEADPSRPSPGVARWDFGSMQGYALREADAPTIVPLPIFGPAGPVGDQTAGELRLSPKAPTWWEDGERINQMRIDTQLTAELTQPYATRRSLKTDGALAISNPADVPADIGVLTESFWIRGWLYDPGGSTAGRLQRFTVFTSANAIILSIGVFEAQSTTHYVASVGASHASTGVARSVGWHELLIFISEPNAGNATIRFYMPESGSAAVRTETTIDIATPRRLGFRQLGISASNDHAFWDDLWVGYNRSGTTDAVFSGIVEANGTRVFPPFQPADGIEFFRDVTITQRIAGTDSMSLGAITLTFRHSTDSGATWSAPAALTTPNVQALKCAANGDDVFEITAAMTSTMDDMGSPALTRIDLGFEPARRVRSVPEDFGEMIPGPAVLEEVGFG